MSQEILVNVDDPAGVLVGYGAGALLHLERSATQAGVYAEISTQVVVTAKDQYAFWDDTVGSETGWYRSFVSTSAGANPSSYSDAFQASSLTAYATVDDLAELIPDIPDGTNRPQNLLADLLVRASAHMTAKCGRDFYRHPQVAGTETRYFNTDGSGSIFVPEGIVSLATLSYATSEGGTFAALGAQNTDWFLEPLQPEPGDSYYVIRLARTGTLHSWYSGRRLASAVGVFGYAAVPEIIRAGTLALARQMWALTPSGSGQALGGAEYSDETVPMRYPSDTWQALLWGSRRMSWALV